MAKQSKYSDIPNPSTIDQRRVPISAGHTLPDLPLKDYGIFPHEGGHPAGEVHKLALLSKTDIDPPTGQIFVADRQRLLALAVYILDTLDPVTDHQVLARIRRLVA